MKHIDEALAEMLDLPQFTGRGAKGTTVNDHSHERAMHIAHLESALRLLRNHAASRDNCERTRQLIAETETCIETLRGGDSISPESEPEWPTADADHHDEARQVDGEFVAAVMMTCADLPETTISAVAVRALVRRPKAQGGHRSLRSDASAQTTGTKEGKLENATDTRFQGSSAMDAMDVMQQTGNSAP